MYTHCLFCAAELGRNESVEHFAIGRRLAFDAARGRLWVVCRACGRWCLSPLEERWEAIEECERSFHDTRLRVSTGNVGLARLREGLELVRVGQPLRPEMAAWRYGDQFGRRRRRNVVRGAVVGTAGLLVVGGASWLAGSGLLGGALFRLALVRRVVARIDPEGGGARLAVRSRDVGGVTIAAGGEGGWRLAVKAGGSVHEVGGPAAERVFGVLLPHLNWSAGREWEVQDAVEHLERAGDPASLIPGVAARLDAAVPRYEGEWKQYEQVWHVAARLPAPTRLAMEMAVHEESERRAMEGELHLLEAAWREAEEIAAISDSLLVPASITARLRTLGRAGEAPSPPAADSGS